MRDFLESRERKLLAPYAAHNADSLGREHPEREHSLRPAFQRDRDRIIHTAAFRRLEYKTQVFVNHEGDHYRTRLTHTIEVSQIARSIAPLLKMQFSRRKAEYVIGVAQAATEGKLESDAFRDLPLEEAIERLCVLRGVGRWSAEQALYRALGRIEALPGGDLGVQKVVAWYCFGEKRVDEKRVRDTARRWEPWGSLATTYLFAAWRAGIPPRMRKR